MRRVVTLCAFFGLGAVWLWVSRAVLGDRPEVVVFVSAGAGEVEVARAIDEGLLVELGMALGWRQDPLIRDRAVRVASHLEGAPDPLSVALALDLPRRDPLMRQRLIDRALQALPEPALPSDAELAELAHALGLRTPPARTFAHRFTRDAARAQALLAADPGEPELVLGPLPTRTQAELARVLGGASADAIMTAPMNRWTLVQSRLGFHAVWPRAELPGRQAGLDETRAALTAKWRAARRDALRTQALAELRASFAVTLARLP